LRVCIAPRGFCVLISLREIDVAGPALFDTPIKQRVHGRHASALSRSRLEAHRIRQVHADKASDDGGTIDFIQTSLTVTSPMGEKTS
jgi:hypothetical protein